MDMNVDADPFFWMIDTYLSAVNAQEKAVEEESGQKLDYTQFELTK